MRLFLNYNSDMLSRKTERINLPQISTTDQLISQIIQRVPIDTFYIRFNIDGEYVRVIPGWLLSHYGIKHGSSLHLEFYQKTYNENINTSVDDYPRQPARKLSRIEEELEEEEEIRVRQDTALSKMSEKSSYDNQDQQFDDELHKLLKAGKQGQLEEINKIVQSNRKLLNEFGESGWALIHYVVFYDHNDILRYLIGQKVMLHLVTSDGWTPLQLSIKKRNITTFKTLISAKGINVNQVTEKGTALHLAVKMNLEKFVDILVQNRADDSLKDESGKTPIQLCEDNNIRQSLIVPQREDIPEEVQKIVQPKIASKLGLYKGIIYRVRFLTYAMKQNYLVCDPFQGTLKRYQSKSQYPKKPKQVIPLLQVLKIQILKKEDTHVLMRAGFFYFQIFYPDRLILATKSKDLTIQWVKAIFEASFYVHKNKDITQIVNVKDYQTFELMDDDEKKQAQKLSKQKNKVSAFKKQKLDSKSGEDKFQTPRSKISQSIFIQHLNESVLQHSGSVKDNLNKSAFTPEIQRSNSTRDDKKYQTDNVVVKQQVKQKPETKQISKFDDSSIDSSRSRSSSYESGGKKQNFSTMAEEPKIGISSFQILRELGSGSFGKVFLAKLSRTKEMYALKALKKSALIAKKQLKYAIGEANVLKKLMSPFIIQLHYAFQTPNYLYLCLDYCPNGDLSQYLVIQEDGILPQSKAKFLIGQLILAVEHMHKQNVIYRDLKPENVLIGSDGFIRLADFGLSRSDVANNLCTSFCGSPAYLSPEMLKQKGVGKESDVYGLGCILYQMLIGQPPYYHDDMEILYDNIQKGNLKFTGRISSSAKQLIQRLLQRDPTKRITIEKVKKHSFFNDVDFQALQRKEVGRINLDGFQTQQQEEEQVQLSHPKKPIFIDADYTDDKKINKVSNFSFARP